MKDSDIPWIGQIPETWTIDKFKYHLLRKELRNKGNATVLSLYRDLGIVPKASRDDNHNRTSEDTSKYKWVQKGSFVVNKMKAWQGSVAVSEYEGIVSPAYYVYYFYGNKIHTRFFHFLMRTCYKDEFMRLSGGIRVDQWDLPAEGLENTLIIIPPLKEQQRIADYLDKKCAEVEGLSSNIQKQIEALEQYKRAVITETVTKGLNPSAPMKDSGIPWIGQIPASWSTLPLRYWMLSRQSGAWGENEQQNQDDHPCVRVADFDYDTYQLKDNTPTTLRNYTQQTVNLLALKKNDILIEKSGGGEKTPVGRSIIIRKDFDFPTLFANFVERIRIKPMYCAIYVEYALVAFYKQGLSTFYFQQTTGIQNLNITKMFRMENIPCPSLHEQQAIADYLDKKCAKIDGIIRAKQQQLEELEQYKKALIFEYVTGKKQVPEV